MAAFPQGNAFSIVVAATAVILLAAGMLDRLPTAWDWRWLQFLGAISYSLYLIHNPVTGAVFPVGFMLTGRNAYIEAFWWLVLIFTCISFAWLVWWTIERPSVRLAHAVRYPGN